MEGGVVVVLSEVVLDGAQHDAVALTIQAGHLLGGCGPGKTAEAEEAQQEGRVHRLLHTSDRTHRGPVRAVSLHAFPHPHTTQDEAPKQRVPTVIVIALWG